MDRIDGRTDEVKRSGRTPFDLVAWAKHTDTTGPEHAVLRALIDHINSERAELGIFRAWPSYDKLAEESHFCRRTVLRAIHVLIGKGLVRIIPRAQALELPEIEALAYDPSTNVFQLLPDESLNESRVSENDTLPDRGVTESHLQGDGESPPQCQRVTPGGDGESPKLLIRTENRTENRDQDFFSFLSDPDQDLEIHYEVSSVTDRSGRVTYPVSHVIDNRNEDPDAETDRLAQQDQQRWEASQRRLKKAGQVKGLIPKARSFPAPVNEEERREMLKRQAQQLLAAKQI